MAATAGPWCTGLGAVLATLAACTAATRPGLSRVAARGAALAAVLATSLLARAFLVEDWSLVYVVDHSRRGVPAVDRLMGVWGGMGGSLLLFSTMVGGFALAGTRRRLDRAAAFAVVAALLWTVRLLADPFRTLDVPAVDGGGLTPILEHWAMRVHPPLTYAGLTVLVVPFARTLGALARQALDDEWWSGVVGWLRAAWVLLAAGMALGSHWAYVELGWGGYWAWDPVENTALLPWVAVTVGAHGGLLAGGRRVSAAGVRAAACAGAFVLALVGAVLTRSGATGSVHAFAEARSVGRALGVLLVATLAVLAVLALRVRRAGPGAAAGSPAGTSAGVAEGMWVRAVRVQQVALTAVVGVVLAGSVWPLVRAVLDGERTVVQGRFFSTATAPFVVVAAAALAVGPGPHGRSRRLAGGGSAVVAAALAAAGGWGLAGTALAAVAAPAGAGAVAGAAATLRRRERRLASHVAHLGVSLLLLGVAGTTAGTQVTERLELGGATEVGGHEVVLDAVRTASGPTPRSTAVVADVTVDGHRRSPSLVVHQDRRYVLAETSLRSTPLADVQVVLRDADDTAALLTVNVAPLQQVVWWGAVLVVGALAVGALPRRVRTRPASPSRSCAPRTTSTPAPASR